MGNLEDLNTTNKWHYIQAAQDGEILDRNKLFHETFKHLEPTFVQHIIYEKDLRKVIFASEQAKRKNENPTIVKVRTKRVDGNIQLSVWLMTFQRSFFVAIGQDLELPDNEFIEQIVFAINHKLRSNTARIHGLVMVIQESQNSEIATMLVNSILELDEEYKSLMKLIGENRK